MSLAKTFSRRRKRVAARHAKKATNNNAPSQELVDNPSSVPACANQQVCETASDVEPDEISVEATELLDSLMQFAASDNDDSSLQSEAEPDSFTILQPVDDSVSICRTDTKSETAESKKELVDPSSWFVATGDNCFEELIDRCNISTTEESSEEPSVDFAFTPISETTPDKETPEDVYFIDSSTVVDADEVAGQVIDSAPAQATEPVLVERREQERKDSSQLVWVEYFDQSMQCVGKEVTRTENIGDHGMRVYVKAAPPGLEKVRVSYSYRGFESYAIVRNRYLGEDGQERLCLEFVDKEWKAHTTSAPVVNDANPVRLGRILFAEDDPAFRKIIGKILTRAGYDVVFAEDGKSAVEKAATEKPDLVITDGLMPKMNGFLVCKAIKELDPSPKVIMLTAVYTNPSYKWEARTTFGADDIITKPCEIAHLLRQIEKHMPPQSQQAL